MPVRFDHSIHVPGDEICFFAVDAPSSRDATLAAQRAGLDPVHVVRAHSSRNALDLPEPRDRRHARRLARPVTLAGWIVAAFALGLAAVLALYAFRAQRPPTPPYTLPADPMTGDILQAFSPVAVRRSSGVCFDYSDSKTWAARVCYLGDVHAPPIGHIAA
jgi:hypothetical protein